MSQPNRIRPRTLRGFRDLMPDEMNRKEAMLDRIRAVFWRYGFLPIDTPALEYAEVLLAKAGGETQQQVYRFVDQGGRDVALRFDLTVPLARFAAAHIQELGTPFKRYHMGPVWRGENTARGRFREFWQCDFDTIGTTSPLADLEVSLVIDALLRELDIGDFTMRISDRSLLSALLARLGAAEHTIAALRAIDKLDKIGRAGVERELAEGAGLDAGSIAAVFDLVGLEGEPHDVLGELADRLGDTAGAATGIERLRVIFEGLGAAGVPRARARLDLSIARGFDYYTGPVFETRLDDEPDLGSICSGGRYDDLAGLYTRQALPGTGASLGIDRLLDAIDRRSAGAGRQATADVLVLLLDATHRMELVQVAERLRGAGIATELFPEPKKIHKQLQYADRRGHRLAVIAGPEELAAGVWSVKILDTGEQRDGILRSDLTEVVQSLLHP
ncbi:MAG: histidine--tRNA ligase [Candidatus Eiseniibacteriota bacterium]|jgi:histidyl-tRNA synthetase